MSDDIRYLDFGLEDEREFFKYSLDSLELSYIDQFPQNYKIAGFSIIRNLDSVHYDRETYDLLACISDIGGLECAILLIGALIMKQFTGFLATVYYMPYIFYYRPSS